MPTQLLRTVLCAALLLTACKGEPAPDQRDDFERYNAMIPRALIAGIPERTREALKAHETLTCERPLLRGEALEGTAEEDILAFAVGSEPKLQQCEDAVRAAFPRLVANEVPGAGLTDAARARIVAACGALADLAARAVAHVDACSPFLPGRRSAAEVPSGLRQRFLGVALVAADMASKGKADEALALATDLLRLSQDVGRGNGASYVFAIFGTVAARDVMQLAVEPALALKPAPSPEALRGLHQALGALLLSEPPFGDLVAGWRFEFLSMSTGSKVPTPELARLDPDDDWPGDIVPAMWLLSERIFAPYERACPPEASVEVCREGLLRVRRDLEKAAGEGSSDRARLLLDRISSAPNWDRERLDVLTDLLASMMAPQLDKYLARYDERRQALEKLRDRLDAQL